MTQSRAKLVSFWSSIEEWRLFRQAAVMTDSTIAEVGRRLWIEELQRLGLIPSGETCTHGNASGNVCPDCKQVIR